MAQISYGTITVTDTTDIESITVEYAQNQSTSSAPDSGWSTTRPTWAEGYYIWQRSRIHKSGTLEEEDEFGTAVCITGSKGDDGRGLTNTETKYTNVAEGTTKAQIEALQDNAWVSEIPSYDSSKPDYWVRIKNTYDKTPTTEYIYYKDNATSNALATAALANSIATHSNENAQGAMSQAASNVNSVTRLWWSQATSTPVPGISTIITDGAANRRGAWSNIRPTDDEAYPYYFYCDQTITGGGVASWSTVTLDTSTLSKYEIIATNVRTQNFFKGKDATYDGWFASGRSSDNGLKENDAETYYYNARFGATHIALGYNKTPVIDLDGSNGTINIYRFPTIDSTSNKVTSAGALGMRLSATSLIFYEPPVGNNNPVAAATLNANGLNIVDGSIELANGTNDSVKISNSDFARNINNISRSNLRMAIGSKFGVKNDGTLYATGAEISGDLTASSLKINGNNYLTDITTISSKASNNAEYEVVIKVNSIDYTNSSATLIAIPTKLGESTTGSFVWYKNAISTAHGGTVSTTTNTNDTLTVSDLDALYIAVLQ